MEHADGRRKLIFLVLSMFTLFVTQERTLAQVVGEGSIYSEGEAECGEIITTGECDHLVSLSLLLRFIEFFNSTGYHCQAGTEDGYAVGPGDETCIDTPMDDKPKDWRISLSEMLRVIQFYNSGGYHGCLGSEDGFCPGL